MYQVWTSARLDRSDYQIDYQILIEREGKRVYEANCPCGKAKEYQHHLAANRAVQEALEWITANEPRHDVKIEVFTSDYAVAQFWKEAKTRFKDIRFDGIGNGKNPSRQMGIELMKKVENKKIDKEWAKVGALRYKHYKSPRPSLMASSLRRIVS